MALFYFTALSIVAAVACAQPQSDPARTSRAITLIGNTAYLFGGMLVWLCHFSLSFFLPISASARQAACERAKDIFLETRIGAKI